MEPGLSLSSSFKHNSNEQGAQATAAASNDRTPQNVGNQASNQTQPIHVADIEKAQDPLKIEAHSPNEQVIAGYPLTNKIKIQENQVAPILDIDVPDLEKKAGNENPNYPAPPQDHKTQPKI